MCMKLEECALLMKYKLDLEELVLTGGPFSFKEMVSDPLLIYSSEIGVEILTL